MAGWRNGVTMKLPLALTAILFCAALGAAVPRTAAAQAGPQAGRATGAVAGAGAGAGTAGAGTSGAPTKAGSANAASAHAALAAQATARLQARATEEKIAANARSGRLAKQQRAALLQGHRQAQQNAAQTLSRAQSRQRLSSARTAGATMAGATTARFATAGSVRAPAAGEGLAARDARGATATSQPGLRVGQTGVPSAIAPKSRASLASGAIGGPQRQLSGRLGGPALGPAPRNAAIDGSQMRRRF